MRTTKNERRENARQFYNSFKNGICDKAAIVVKRLESSNPHITRCQFWAVPSAFAFTAPVVIAESVLGIEGCFIELIGSISNCPQKTYHEDGFNDWLSNVLGIRITYKDGLVFILEKETVEKEDPIIINFRETAETIAESLKYCDFDDVADSTGYFVIRKFEDDSERCVDVYKSTGNGEQTPHYVIYVSYEDESSDYSFTESLSVDELAAKLEELSK